MVRQQSYMTVDPSSNLGTRDLIYTKYRYIYIISNDVYKNDVFLYDLTRTDDSIIIIESKSCMVIYNI